MHMEMKKEVHTLYTHTHSQKQSDIIVFFTVMPSKPALYMRIFTEIYSDAHMCACLHTNVKKKNHTECMEPSVLPIPNNCNLMPW